MQVVVLGGATMLAQSPRFTMVEPTIVHFAIAAVMLRRGWTLRYLPEIDTTYCAPPDSPAHDTASAGEGKPGRMRQLNNSATSNGLARTSLAPRDWAISKKSMLRIRPPPEIAMILTPGRSRRI